MQVTRPVSTRAPCVSDTCRRREAALHAGASEGTPTPRGLRDAGSLASEVLLLRWGDAEPRCRGLGRTFDDVFFLVCVTLILFCGGGPIPQSRGPASRRRASPSAHSFSEGTVPLGGRRPARAQTHLRPGRAKRPAPIPVGTGPSGPSRGDTVELGARLSPPRPDNLRRSSRVSWLSRALATHPTIAASLHADGRRVSRFPARDSPSSSGKDAFTRSKPFFAFFRNREVTPSFPAKKTVSRLQGPTWGCPMFGSPAKCRGPPSATEE